MNISSLQLGEPGGVPILFFHGFPGSIYEAKLLKKCIQNFHCQVFAFDRPGYGDTDFRWRENYPAYYDEVLRRINPQQKILVIGISGGGPFATDFALQHAKKVQSLSLICALAGLKDPKIIQSFPKPVRALLKAYAWMPDWLRLATFHTAKVARGNSAEKFFEGFIRRMPPNDQEILRRPEVFEVMCASFLQARKQDLKGCVGDLDYYLNWSPPPEAVQRLTIRAYHGTTDTIVYLPSFELFKATWPGIFTRLTNDAHFSLPVNQVDLIFKDITSDLYK